MESCVSIADRISNIYGRISRASEIVDRDPNAITLVAVSKNRSIDDILRAYDAGVRNFGENRSDELLDKKEKLSEYKDIVWHYIGRLQSRQVKVVAPYADYIHSVDRIKIAQTLSKLAVKQNSSYSILIEVNISGEQSKAGFDCKGWGSKGEIADRFLSEFSTIANMPGLDIKGLMTMAPFGAPEEEIRQVFRITCKICNFLQDKNLLISSPELSMGMSNDFEIAIEEGSTCVRVGRAIFE